MKKIILITGATDGIGLETAKALISQGHHVLLHGRNPTKLTKVKQQLTNQFATTEIETYVADLSRIADVYQLIEEVTQRHDKLDVLINNAGVFNSPEPITPDGLDIRFVVNTLAPYLLTKELLPLLDENGRVINLSSAAQASVNLEALSGKVSLSDNEAYAQSKLAITMWTRALAHTFSDNSDNKEKPIIVAVNPASLLGSKMVKDAFGVAGGDLSIGSDILCRAALSDEFSKASGLYFDNDIKRFSDPHSDALNNAKVQQVMDVIEKTLAKLTVQK
ncbi:SDR family NAD(P)-dependent oxidoreductase [Vibrio sp. Of7-15]|uniref:SDR family NAD(P)-dependent oxidoreductase n=1 Tax=Vibrio sp. Of7-15 TaxID=2724879 RepID=UPI001EF2F63A|nr:SDR family NAD(P)-dependent oxidoreductase [Vibrio sp. Of7-15]MCG7497310.1 SDR family NAD(P)-dependent oxidoreductase [Vibrio sp. Of7-15]